jgi:hypothetical protein
MDPPDLASMTMVACSMFSEKSLGLRVFSTEGLNRRKGDVRGWTRRSHPLVAWARPRPRHHRVWLALGPSPALLWTTNLCQVIRDFNFCFVQFQEYFLCNFSEIQK